MKNNNWENNLKAWMLGHYISTSEDDKGRCAEFYINDLCSIVAELIAQEKENWLEELESRQIKE